MPLRPLSNSASVTDNLIHRLQEAMWRGELIPGDILPSHHELAIQYGVGLSTLREAIKALAMVGLVEVRPGRGTRVLPNALTVLTNLAAAPASAGNVDYVQAYEARSVIEVALARLAAERAVTEDVQAMRGALAEMQAALEDSSAFVHADWRFHLAVAEAAKNMILAQMYYLIRGILQQMMLLTVQQPGAKLRGIQYQGELVEAIAANDPERAARCTQQHIESFRTDWIAATQRSVTSGPGGGFVMQTSPLLMPVGTERR